MIKGLLSVQELSLCLKQLIRDAFPIVAVYGEISNLRRMKDVLFFTLKDAYSQISVIVFKEEVCRFSQLLQEGQSFVIEGRIDLYVASGRYQIIAKNIRKIGQGILQQQFESLKSKLKQEGLFDLERKKSIPLLPKTIGVVTSLEAAALQDFLHILERKMWKGCVLVSPALVQGCSAPASLMKALKKIQKENVDVMVLIRGGGSFEDLNCFNDERLIRTLSQRNLPIITGIGHETDITLCDFIADFRAETPTAAAEYIANHYQVCCQRLEKQKLQFTHAFDLHYHVKQQRFMNVSKTLSAVSLHRNLFAFSEKLNHQKRVLNDVYCLYLKRNSQKVEFLRRRLGSIDILQRIKQTYQILKKQTDFIKKGIYDKKRTCLHWVNRLQSLSLERQLQRGFLVPMRSNGKGLARIEHQDFGKNRVLLSSIGKLNVKILNKCDEN